MLKIAGMLAIMAGPALAHQSATGWAYPPNCCANTDCNVLPSERVSTPPDGYHITVLPGDHQIILEGFKFTIHYSDDRIKLSPDSDYHLCAARPPRIICFFIPSQGS